MGIMDVLSELCPASTLRGRRRMKKRPQLTTLEMKVRIDCEGCERKIRKALRGLKGVTAVEVVPKQSKVAVTGYIDDPAKLMRRVARKTGKPVEPWPYVPYDVVAQPYASGAYDKKAPPGYLRNVNAAGPAAAPFARASSMEPWRSSTPPPSPTTTPTPRAPSCNCGLVAICSAVLRKCY